MCRKLIYLASFVLLLGLATGVANADLTTGLVGSYPLDEGAGSTATDMSGSGHDGTLYNGVTWISQGAKGGGVNVNGTTDTRIELGTWNPAAGTGQMSLGMWIRWSGGGGTYQGLVGKRDTWPDTTMFQFQVRPESNGTFRIETGTTAIISPDGTLAPLIGEWAHVAATFDGTTARLYLNGEQVASGAFALNSAGSGSNMGIGCVTGGGTGYSGNTEVFSGDIDDVYIYNRALSETEILSLMAGLEEYPYAGNPVPADGAMYTNTWISLGWHPGDSAASHDVYFGESYDDVVNGTGGTFQVNQTGKYFILGFAPYPYPEGLVPGITYYWRIDEVEADGTTKHKGKIWSFTIPPNKAYNPSPIDGIGLVPLQATLTWSAGHNSGMHYVYFGDDYDTVANALDNTGEVVSEASYSPTGPLQANKTYYWRVDESNPQAHTYFKGDVWSFTTQSDKPTGLLAQYFTHTGGTIPSNAFQTLVLTRIDENVNFAWGAGSPDPAIPVDNYAARWTGEVTIPVTADWTFYTATDDGQRLWVNGQLLIDDWNNHGTTEVAGTVYLEAGTYPIEMHYFEGGGGAAAYLRWECEFVPKAIIPSIALSPPVKASGPRPGNGEVDINHKTLLKWSAGQSATTHNLFFGTDATAVENATTASPEFKGNIALGNESYDPTGGGELAWDTNYYWRVDEVNDLEADSPWTGSVWSFRTANYLILEDFEDYNDEPPDRVFETWIDGFGGSTNGSISGYPYPVFADGEHFCETSIIHGGLQSMPFFYDNNMKYSEVTKTLVGTDRDWTQYGVKALNLWYYGHIQSQGSFVEGPAGTYTITGAGADIWGGYDECHFAWKILNSGATEIIAKVSAPTGQNLNDWAKTGVMIRESLDPNSPLVFMCLSNTQGISFQYRSKPADDMEHVQLANVSERPQWLRLTKDIAGTFTGYHANDVGGAPGAWVQVGSEEIQMNTPCYIGMANTSHQAYVPATVVFSNITTTGAVSGTIWTNQDIGIQSNAPERMYVMIKDGAGQMATVYNPNLNAANVTAWTQWGQYGQGIALSEFTAVNPSLNLANIDSISLGLGTRGNTTQPGGSGLMFIDDIGLYKPRCVYQLVKPVNDYSNNCVVDMPDLEILTDNWLKSNWQVTPETPSTTGLVGYYRLENNAQDSSGQGHHGDANNAPTYVAGQTGQGMMFNGSNQYVDLGTWDPSAGTGQLTVALWANWNGLSGLYQGLIGKRNIYANADMMWQIEANVDAGALGFFRAGSTPDDGDFVLPIGQWTHVAATFDGTTATFYINGSATGSGDFSFGSDTEATVVFGACEANGGNPFNGALDEVRLYNRALSQGEVASLAGKSAAFDQELYLLLRPMDTNIDTNSDGTIDFQDYAGLIDTWLDEQLWP